jgi:N-acetylneuraminate synthase/N,N'-diacetyllegionaminate synthase
MDFLVAGVEDNPQAKAPSAGSGMTTMATDQIIVSGRKIGVGAPVFVIAEAGVNHNGSVDMACELVEAAARAGADAVKFQTFIAENLVAADAPKAEYQKETTPSDESQLEMVKALELSFADFTKIKAHCEATGIVFLSTPFDFESVDFLSSLDIPAFKISSGDLTNHPLLDYVARKNKPVILSTGMSNLGEVEEAAKVVRSTGNERLVILHCVTNYPAEPGDVNLRAMHTMADALQVPVGYSDHTVGSEIALAAVALGACVVEKHFTLDRDLPGPDHRASLEPGELAEMIRGIRRVEAALGDGRKFPRDSELATAAVARRSLVAIADIPVGTVIGRDMVAMKRPGTGLPPAMLNVILGRTAVVDISSGSILAMEMFE